MYLLLNVSSANCPELHCTALHCTPLRQTVAMCAVAIAASTRMIPTPAIQDYIGYATMVVLVVPTWEHCTGKTAVCKF